MVDIIKVLEDMENSLEVVMRWLGDKYGYGALVNMAQQLAAEYYDQLESASYWEFQEGYDD